jgi:hypothetical protein
MRIPGCKTASFEFNAEKKGWHYGFNSNRFSHEQHSFVVYFFLELCGVHTCIGCVESSGFRVFSQRRARSESTPRKKAAACVAAPQMLQPPLTNEMLEQESVSLMWHAKQLMQLERQVQANQATTGCNSGPVLTGLQNGLLMGKTPTMNQDWCSMMAPEGMIGQKRATDFNVESGAGKRARTATGVGSVAPQNVGMDTNGAENILLMLAQNASKPPPRPSDGPSSWSSASTTVPTKAFVTTSGTKAGNADARGGVGTAGYEYTPLGKCIRPWETAGAVEAVVCQPGNADNGPAVLPSLDTSLDSMLRGAAQFAAQGSAGPEA